MELSVSILSIKESLEKNIKILDECNIDLLHIDIMDGKFTKNKTWDITKIKPVLEKTTHPLDIHLMVEDIYKYIEDFKVLNPKYLTFHIEATDNPKEIIDKIHTYNIKAGVAISPDTDVDALKDILEYADLILVMSVTPGLGGQEFISSVTTKMNYLKKIQSKYNFVIEVDGGINDKTIKQCNCDIVVVGSFITNGNYSLQIEKLEI